MCKPEHESLTQRAIAGERLAMQQLLLAEHDQLMQRIARRIPPGLRSVVAAEDVCQDAYVAAFQKMRDFKPYDENGFERWLTTIAMRVLLREIRGRRTLKRGGRIRIDGQNGAETSIVNLLELLAVHERTPSQSAAGREAVLAVRSALQTLPDERQEAIRLRYIEGMNLKDAAATMRRSEAAVTMLCQRGMRTLREELGDASNFLSRS